MAKKKQDAESESAFSDISEAQEQERKDLEQPALDPETGEAAPASAAAREVAEEMATRRSAQANGGGPRSAEWLLAHGTKPTPLRR